MPIPQVGDAAPEVRFQDGEGGEKALSSVWRQGTVVLVFLRHLG